MISPPVASRISLAAFSSLSLLINSIHRVSQLSSAASCLNFFLALPSADNNCLGTVTDHSLGHAATDAATSTRAEKYFAAEQVGLEHLRSLDDSCHCYDFSSLEAGDRQRFKLLSGKFDAPTGTVYVSQIAKFTPHFSRCCCCCWAYQPQLYSCKFSTTRCFRNINTKVSRNMNTI